MDDTACLYVRWVRLFWRSRGRHSTRAGPPD